MDGDLIPLIEVANNTLWETSRVVASIDTSAHLHHYNYAIGTDTVVRGCVYCGECKVARIGEGVWRDLAEKPESKQ